GTIPFAIPLANHHHKIIIGHNHYVKLTDMKKRHEELIAMVETENAGTRLNDAKCDAAENVKLPPTAILVASQQQLQTRHTPVLLQFAI
ncbi:hypothetical protein HPB47_014347, partial [Ixodes persulcatus]